MEQVEKVREISGIWSTFYEDHSSGNIKAGLEGDSQKQGDHLEISYNSRDEVRSGGDCRGRIYRMGRLIRQERWRKGVVKDGAEVSTQDSWEDCDITKGNKEQKQVEVADDKCGWGRRPICYLTARFLHLSQVFIQQNELLPLPSLCNESTAVYLFSYCEFCWALESPWVRERFKGNGNEVCCVF